MDKGNDISSRKLGVIKCFIQVNQCTLYEISIQTKLSQVSVCKIRRSSDSVCEYEKSEAEKCRRQSKFTGRTEKKNIQTGKTNRRETSYRLVINENYKSLGKCM